MAEPEADLRSAARTDLPASPGAAETASSDRLAGRLRTIDVIVAVIAASGPIAAVGGYIPLIIIYGNGSGAPAALLVAGILLAIFTAGYTAMTKYMTNPGALYAYVTAGLGRPAGLATSCLAVVTYGSFLVGVYAFFGLITDDLVQNTFGGPAIPWWIYGLACWVIITVLSYLQIELSAKVLIVALTAEIAIILVWDFFTIGKGGAAGLDASPFTWSHFSHGSIGLAMLFAMGLFVGFETTAIYREETRDNPNKVIPRATYAAVAIMGILYSAAAWVMVMGVGSDKIVADATADPAGLFSTTVGHYVGHVAQGITALLLCTSTIAGQLSCQNVLARYLYSLGVDGILPSRFGKAHHRHGSPHRAAILVSTVVLLFLLALILAGTQATTIYAQFGGLLFYGLLIVIALTSAAILVFFLRNRHLKASVWARYISPTIALVAFAIICYLGTTNFTILSGGSSAVAITFVGVTWGLALAGLVYALVLRKRKPEVYRRIGRNS
ncbi:MAG TPA: APC family permease [Amycolatopsis sp.]|nr:APC family permease [Amycolatopsis sp.]